MDEIERFLELFDRYKSLQQSQKIRGLNDFNVFTILLDKTDEVRLHSRFLHFLLDPVATHSQGALFLELFLLECGLADFFRVLENCNVYKEYRNIDLYITDGDRHIIIENKIYAGDQHTQIQRYIDIIKEDNADDSEFSDNLVIMYLSLDRDGPTTSSLGNFKLNGDSITRGEEKYLFKAIKYDPHIINWIDKSIVQVSNITNLSVGFNQYRDVILKLYKNYEEKVMRLKEYIAGSGEPQKLYKTLKSISDEFQELRKEMIMDFFEEVISKLEVELKGTGWFVEVDEGTLFSGKRWNFPLRIRQSDSSKVLFGFEFGKNDFIDPCWGIVRTSHHTVDFNELKGLDGAIEALLVEVDSSLNRETKWWLRWCYYYEGDLYDKIIDEPDINNAINSFVESMLIAFNSSKNVIVKCNEVLDKNA